MVSVWENFNIKHYNKVYGFTKSLNIQHCQIIALNGYLLILPASFLAHRKFNIQQSTFKINHHESKLEIRHQFRHHCPHRRPQLFLHAELQVIYS